MILGIGTDITEIARIQEMIDRHGDVFLERIFTPKEIEYCSKHKNSVINYAGRWAAKEAILKCLGTGFTKGVGWQDLEILNLPSGRPVVKLSGHALDLSQRVGIEEVLISISHGKDYAVATALAQGTRVEFLANETTD
jgi:holo-[acyl-carrier protein] synthase